MIMYASVSRQTTEDVEEKTDNDNGHQDLYEYPSNILECGDRLFELGDYNIRGRIDLDWWHSLIRRLETLLLRMAAEVPKLFSN
jgi:hypothetical protein